MAAFRSVQFHDRLNDVMKSSQAAFETRATLLHRLGSRRVIVLMKNVSFNNSPRKTFLFQLLMPGRRRQRNRTSQTGVVGSKRGIKAIRLTTSLSMQNS